LTGKYDAWNRLVEVTDGATLVGKYTYDATGRRIIKQTGAVWEHFFLNGQQVIETREASSSGAHPESLSPTYQYVWSPRYVDAPIARDTYTAGTLQPASRLYYLNDANFNVTALVNASGFVVERYAYSPYGKATVLEADFTPNADNLSDFSSTTLFAGRELDPETGLYYNRARYYSADLGRFVSQDPIGFEAGDTNLYRYTGNRPVVSTDATGFASTTDDAGRVCGESQLSTVSLRVQRPSKPVRTQVTDAIEKAYLIAGRPATTLGTHNALLWAVTHYDAVSAVLRPDLDSGHTFITIESPKAHGLPGRNKWGKGFYPGESWFSGEGVFLVDLNHTYTHHRDFCACPATVSKVKSQAAKDERSHLKYSILATADMRAGAPANCTSWAIRVLVGAGFKFDYPGTGEPYDLAVAAGFSAK
jgi:RHS repeat-associated protein